MSIFDKLTFSYIEANSIDFVFCSCVCSCVKSDYNVYPLRAIIIKFRESLLFRTIFFEFRNKSKGIFCIFWAAIYPVEFWLCPAKLY